jgi:hypothetical protein
VSDTEGDLKVVYIPQVPMAPYEVPVKTLEEARIVLDAVVGLSMFEYEHNVKPDYSDYAGVVRFEDGEWNDVDEEEWEL